MVVSPSDIKGREDLMRASRFIFMMFAMLLVFGAVDIKPAKADLALNSGTAMGPTGVVQFLVMPGNCLHWYTGEGMDELACQPGQNSYTGTRPDGTVRLIDFWWEWGSPCCTETITPPVGPPIVNQYTVTYDP